MQYTVVKRILFIVLLIMISALGSVKAQVYQIGDVYTFPDSSKGIICYINPDNPVEGWAVALNDVGWVSKTNNKQYFMIDAGTALPAGMVQHPYDAVNGIGRSSLDSWTFEGKENTRLLLNSGHSDAAEAVDFYNGWYIPDAVQLRMIYGLLPVIADKIIAAGGSSDCLEFMYAKNTYGYDYWTSTRINSNQMLVVRGSQYFYQARTPSNHSDASDKERATQNRIRAVRNFGTEAYAYWADSPTDASMEVSPGVGQTSYDAYVIFNSDTVEVVTSSAIVHEKYDKDTIYREVCRSDTRYTFQEPVDRDGNPVFKNLNISTPHDYQPIRETLQTIYGCDSVITLMLKVNPVYEINATDNICQSDTPYVWRTKKLYETGVYYDSLKTTCCNCDSVYVLNLIVAPMPEISFSPDNPLFCKGSSGIEVTASATNCADYFRESLFEGFDGVTGKDVNITSELPGKTSMFEDGYLVFSSNGAVRLGRRPEFGRIESKSMGSLGVTYDFTVELSMKGWDYESPTPSRVRVSVDSQADTLTVPGGIPEVAPAQYETYSVNFNAAASSSIITIEVIPDTVLGYDYAEQRVFIDWVRIKDNSPCVRYTWFLAGEGTELSEGPTFNITELESTTTYEVEVESASGCVVREAIEVEYAEPTWGDTVVNTCEPFTWHGTTYTKTPKVNPTYIIEGGNQFGCDSIVTLFLTISDSIKVTTNMEVCDSLVWIDGNTYKSNGTYRYVTTTSSGCDSIIILKLTVNRSTTVPEVRTVCQNELPYTWNDSVFTSAGEKTTVLKTVNGCDSIVVMTLTVNDTVIPTFSTNEDVCILSSFANDSIEISVQALAGYDYTWNIDGGSYATSSRTDTNRIVVRWADEGDKIVSVTMRNNATNCESYAEKTIHVHNTPVVKIAAVAGEICPFSGTYEPITATITTTTTADYTYTWGGGVTLTAAATTTSETTNSVTATIPTISCDTLYKIGVNVVDGYGCKANADSITLTVRDMEVPTISGTLRDSIVIGCGADDKPLAVNTLDYLKANGLIISDNCSDNAHLTVTSSDADITGTCNKTIIRTYRVTDGCGNYNEATQNIYINVQDFAVPADSVKTVSCPALVERPDTVAGKMPVVTDACGNTLTAVFVSGGDIPTCEGDVVYTYKYTDCQGHEQEWHFRYTVEREDFAIATAPGSNTV
ncbi:MAG: hypothetical protein J6X16_01915, partial [Bacteroidales bacterium]|nr:hypothetical protein [Bacteroidales bacterium]